MIENLAAYILGALIALLQGMILFLLKSMKDSNNKLWQAFDRQRENFDRHRENDDAHSLGEVKKQVDRNQARLDGYFNGRRRRAQ